MIRGLSASANRQLASFERANGLHQGEVAHAFRRWALSGRRRSVVTDNRCYDVYPENWRAGDFHVRTLLEFAMWALRRKARREFRDALRPLDDKYLRRTVNNPFARQDLHWWLRRIEL
ncbi:hypothetical protein [Phytohabitans aurantiacus]|uniref:Uncharacterized protein n=1 Tax=Phytohabitans aurantiacus TaxID=3016789 RepID=A0ABQ5QVQ4_9ACTN|nr:hypothetical protein [Phytohabitans aurantiacus]GLH98651.1 hypothetical protein Pa4123_39260 [Phytohabitans aurantiacus]